MLIVAAPVDLVLGLTLIAAAPRTPISISLKCWVVFFIKDAEATCVKIATEMKKCSRLKEMSNLNVL